MISRDFFPEVTLPRFADRLPDRPFVVALEGPNGAGKTTLCAGLSDRLKAPSCLGTDPAWFTPAFKTRMIRDAEWHGSALFFLSGCFEQMRLLQQRSEKLIVMDRSLWSTLAVHAAEEPRRLKILMAVLQPIACNIQVPDLTLILRASFKTCQSRIAKKDRAAQLLDGLTSNRAFHDRELEFYAWLAQQQPNCVFIDVDQPNATEVAFLAQSIIRERLPC
jgi:thymidylate kinase